VLLLATRLVVDRAGFDADTAFSRPASRTCRVSRAALLSFVAVVDVCFLGDALLLVLLPDLAGDDLVAVLCLSAAASEPEGRLDVDRVSLAALGVACCGCDDV